ncbi:protein FAM83B-like isoform X2 [Xyrauchen texanus]|nr:protein FAM83B-like isoform X2 [Xyrauchen texanus]
MDIFTDVDIFKELVDASVRGVPVYILLDHDYFKSFLTMVEKQDVQIQKLRNMRVRTVKGQEYCCRSGAKFHGRMGQKFILFDCQTAFFGSYSFMWSYEKINLSIMQVITGKLVETYDEEFRTLYARSTIPTPFQTPDRQCDMRPNGKMDGYLIHSNNPFERKDHLRHTLDAVYRQTCERRSGFSQVREIEERPVHASHNRLLQETSDFYKRHSYAGKRQEPACIPQLSKYGSSNWNVAAESCRYGGFSNNMDNQYESYVVHPMYRGSHIRQSYHGHDKQVLNMRQKLPSLASSSKSFLRTWRIESYLNNNNNNATFGENIDYLDQYEENKMAPPQHSRLRSSMVFTSTIPEQPETNSYTNNSASFNHDQAGFQSNAQIYSSTQWNQPYTGTNTNFNFGRDAIYASLNKTKNQFINNEPDIQQDNWYKRHSVADPRTNTYNNEKIEPSSYMYASLPRRPRDKVSTNELPRTEGYTPNLKESQISKDQRSISHYDVEKADESTTTSGIWQEPPSRTVSATLLDTEDSLPSKSIGVTSPRFLKRSTKKIRSLLNIPQKGDGSPKRKNGSSLKSSTDTILSDDDAVRDKKCHSSTTNSIKSINSSRFRNAGENKSGLVGETSAPQFSTDKLHQGQTTSAAETAKTQEHIPVITQNERSDATLSTSDLLPKQQVPANRLYSRFEPLCSFESKSPSASQPVSTNSHTTLKTRNSVFLRGEPMSDHNRYTNQQTHGHDNRFGRFIQRVGNLINKNKY